MRIIIGISVLGVCLYFFGWWGFLSLIVVLPFIGWKDRHKGPFLIKSQGTTDWEGGINFNTKYPQSGRHLQDLLVKISKNLHTDDSLKTEISQLLKLLNIEKYEIESDSDKIKLIGFINQFSALFPNWPNEYKIIFDSISIHY